MGGKLCKPFCPRRGGQQHNLDAALPLSACQNSITASFPKTADIPLIRSRGRLDTHVDVLLEISELSVLPYEQIESIVSFLDLATFALAVSPSCLFFYQLVRSESFEGWLTDIKRLHCLCPWSRKAPLEKIIDADDDLRTLKYCKALKQLDRTFIAIGSKVIQESSREPGIVASPSFFDCQEETLVYTCKTCKSFITVVDSTVGRGTMGMQKAAFILQPGQSNPFCCGIKEDRQTRLTSGHYIVADLICPNAHCETSLGWKYQYCLPDGFGSNDVPVANQLKVGQYWVYADSLDVIAPSGSFEGCRGEDFYFMNIF
mmetsp:Transcript_34009/g.54220  ORF Transcript_34009/g.54220 Transcript_34009/m.54220 type:complete len:316 (-) Transcript_34009:173-1120(-)